MSWAPSLPPKDDNSLLSTNIDRGPYCDHIFSARHNSTFKSSSMKLLYRLNRQKLDGLCKKKKKEKEMTVFLRTWYYLTKNTNRNNFQKHCQWIPTWDDSTFQSGDSLHERHVVVGKIVTAGGIEFRAIAEQQPQFCCNSHIIDDFSLQTTVKVMVLQSAVPQHANTVWRTTGFLAD